MVSSETTLFDLSVYDGSGKLIMVAGVKGHPFNKGDLVHLRKMLNRFHEPVPFAMLANADSIRIFRWDGRKISKPLCVLPTQQVVKYYSPSYDREQLSEFFLVTSIESWLRDLNSHWKSESPPYAECLKEIGLLPLMEGGFTEREVIETPTY